MILTIAMAHQRKLIRQAVVALLAGANTAAGARVMGFRTEAYRKGDLPAISVYSLHEDVDPDSALMQPIELTRKLQLEIAAWVLHSDSGVHVDDAMDNIAEQIEAAMASDYYIRSTLAITAVDHTTGRFTIANHGLSTAGSPLDLTAVGGVLPAGLGAPAEYFAIVVDANTVQLASSREDALDGAALTFTGNGTLPLQLRVGTVADQLLESTDMEVIEEKESPLIGVVILTYSITYRTQPATIALVNDFVTVDAKYQLVGGVPSTTPAEDTFTVEAP